MTEAREQVRTEALAFLEQVMTLALQAMAENDCRADPDWRGPAIQQFRDNLLYLGVTSDELDAAGIKQDGEQPPQPNRDELARRIAAERLAHPPIQLTDHGESFTAYLYRDDDESPRCPVCGVGPYESFSLSGMGTGPSVQTFQPCGCARPVTVIAELERDVRAVSIASAIDTVQAVRNQFEPSFALVEFSEALIAQLMAVRRGEPWPVPDTPHAEGADAGCPHMEFEAGVTVQRILGDNLVVAGFWAEVMVACTRCDEVFRWTGLQAGLSPAGPRVSIDHRTLHAPFHRASGDPDEGQGLPGFDVNLVGPELGHERTAAAIRRRALEDAAELVKSRIQPVMSIAARRELRHAEAELRRLALAAP